MKRANIREAMQAKYPAANLGPYFAFLASRPICTRRAGCHKHHIAPRQQFPEYSADPANLIRLTVADHKSAHRILATAIPATAWAQPAFIAAASSAGRIGGRKQAELGLGIHAPGMAAKTARKLKELGLGIHATGMTAKAGRIGGRIGGRKGGRIGGRKCAELGLGCHTPGMASSAGRIGGRKQAELGLGCHALGIAAKGGRKGGRKTAERGQGIHAPGMQAKGRHTRWHVNRGIVSLTCSLCVSTV